MERPQLYYSVTRPCDLVEVRRMVGNPQILGRREGKSGKEKRRRGRAPHGSPVSAQGPRPSHGLRQTSQGTRAEQQPKAQKYATPENFFARHAQNKPRQGQALTPGKLLTLGWVIPTPGGIPHGPILTNEQTEAQSWTTKCPRGGFWLGFHNMALDFYKTAFKLPAGT